MATVYRSKTDAWLLAVLAIAMAASIFGAFMTFAAGSPAAWAISLFTLLLGVGLPLWLVLSTRYTLGHGQLLVQSGPFRWRVPIADITSITPTSNALSSPALSLDRLRIDYGHAKSLMISPRNREQFIRDIEVARRSA
ncbi:MAG: PH domain-containing protein [Burkholderiales bacterium]|nr:PH domain-containing protein [Burkholderiales bacterium]